MGSLIIAILLGLVFAYVATQNTGGVDLRLGEFFVRGVPLYLVAVGSFLFGVLISSMVSAINSIFDAATIHGKEKQIRENEKAVEKLVTKVDESETENARLREEKRISNPGLLDKLRHRLTF